MPVSIRPILLVLSALILSACPSARAEDRGKGLLQRPSLHQRAAMVLAAHKAQDEKALGTLARMRGLKPWLVVDLLCYQGEHDAALALAGALRPELNNKAIPAYIGAWREREPDTADRERLARAEAGREEGPEAVLAALGPPASNPDTVVRNNMAQLRSETLLRLGRADEAAAGFKQAGDAALGLGWLARAAWSYGRAAVAAGEAAAWDEALGHSLERLAVQERRGAARVSTQMLLDIAWAHHQLGSYRQSLLFIERAEEVETQRGKTELWPVVFDRRAMTQLLLGEHDEAWRTLERAHAAYVARGDARGTADALQNMGHVHARRSDYAKALASYEDAERHARKAGAPRRVALSLAIQANVYNDLGDHEQAIRLYERAKAEVEADRANASLPGVVSLLSMVDGNIGATYGALGELTKAEPYLVAAVKAAEAHPNRREVGLRRLNLGSLYLEAGDHAKGRAVTERALEDLEAGKDRRGVVAAQRVLAAFCHKQGDPGTARELLEDAAARAEDIRAYALLVNVRTALAALHLAGDDPARALLEAQQALDALGRPLAGLDQAQGATARGKHAGLFALGMLAAAREGDRANVMRFLERGRAGALLEALGNRDVLRWKAEALPPALRTLDLEAEAGARAARRAYDRMIRSGGTRRTRQAALRALDEALEQVRAVEGRIQRELKQQAGFFYPRANTLEEVEAALEPDQALVLYGLSGQAFEFDEALALVLRREGRRIVPLGKTSEIAAACEALDATDRSADAAPALERLRKRLVEPLGLGGDVTQVLVSPEGPLCYLPFGALFEQTVALTPSGTTHVLLLDEAGATGQGILALGAPDYGGVSEGAEAIYHRGREPTPLPATRKEVETIATQALLGAKASEAGLREALPASKRWRAVHLACHGYVDVERPLLSSLALSRTGDDDGFLTAIEILRTKIPADLVVLSACDTGRGKIVKGEGIVGLTRAFMFAGSPRVICSLWKVNDEATRALMIRFYELWNPKDGEGLGAAEALRTAQAHVRAQEKWRHPYYWAAWVLWGLPD